MKIIILPLSLQGLKKGDEQRQLINNNKDKNAEKNKLLSTVFYELY